VSAAAEPDAVCVDVEGAPIEPDEILVVRRGPGANCSSIGSALDVLFLTATAAGAILVAISAAMASAEKADGAEEGIDGGGRDESAG
jgi:hypothetical protein